MSDKIKNSCDWVRFNHLTYTYDTADGTSVASEKIDNVQCLADVIEIAEIRAKQRYIVGRNH